MHHTNIYLWMRICICMCTQLIDISGKSTLFFKNKLFLFADLLTQLNLDIEMTNTMKTFCRKIYWHVCMTFSWYHDELSILTGIISTEYNDATLEMNQGQNNYYLFLTKFCGQGLTPNSLDACNATQSTVQT